MSRIKPIGGQTDQPHSMPKWRQGAYYVGVGWQPPTEGRLKQKSPHQIRQKGENPEEEGAMRATGSKALHQIPQIDDNREDLH